jgi:hypothetical protein
MTNKNLFFVTLIGTEVPEELFTRYWTEVEVQLSKLEKIYGQIAKLYHEANYFRGEEGMQFIQRINERAYQIFKSSLEKGAELQELEDQEVFWEIADCQLFLTLRFSSKSILDKVSTVTKEIYELYKNSMKKRNDHIPKQISDTLKEGETGILVLREEERIKLQFPPDINLILIRPPVLSDIEKWINEQEAKYAENKSNATEC